MKILKYCFCPAAMQSHAKSGHGRFMINIQQSTRLFVFRFLIEKDRMEIFRRNHLYRNSPGGNRALLQQQCLVQIMRSDEDIVRNHDDALSLARKAVEKTVEFMLKPDVERTGWFIQKAGSAYPVQRRRRAASEVRIPTGISCGAATVRAARSARSRSNPPARMLPGRSLRNVPPQSIRTICGTASPTNPITSATADHTCAQRGHGQH